jgi:hypothetical protein
VSSGMREVVSELQPQLDRVTGQRVTVNFGEAGVRRRISGKYVARGEADLAVLLSNEIRIVPSIEFIPLPAEFERTFVFAVALGSNAKDASASKGILRFLSGQEATAVIRAKGMDTPVSK